MPLIIVEGVDGSGKTTLVQNFRQVAKKLCWIFSRSGPPTGSIDLLMTAQFLARGAQYETPLIVDRHPWVSEPIYGPIIRGKSLIEEVYPRERALEAVASLANRVIYCKTDLETAQKASRRERQMEGVHEQYWALYQAYDAYMEDLRRLGVRVITYDWTQPHNSPELNQLFLGAL
jgi:deoxyadenosine/deoxycytidine kinase